MSTTIFPFEVWPEGILQARIPANDNSLRAEVLSKPAKTIADSAPGSPSEDDLHIVGTAWGGFSSGDVVIRKGGTWLAFAPFSGWIKFNDADNSLYYFSGSTWVLWDAADAGGTSTPVTALSSTSGAVDIDCALGDYFTLALTENITSITFSNLPGSGKGATKMIKITQDTTARTVAWPASFKWAGGSAGAVSTASGAIDTLAITTFDNGTSWEATLANAFA